MSLATTLHDVAPTRLRGLTFLALSELGQVRRRTSVDSRGTVTTGGSWSGGSDGWNAGTWVAGTVTAGTYSGAQVETFTAQTAIPCRVDPMGGSEGQTANRLDERTTHRITVPPQTVVSAKDRFSSTAGTYEITAVRKRTDGQVLILEATEDF